MIKNTIKNKIRPLNEILNNLTKRQTVTIYSDITPPKSTISVSPTNIDFDEIFQDLDGIIMTYLKNNKKLNKYVELRKNWKLNDALWGIYNEIKLEAEGKDDLGLLTVNFNHMFNIVYHEKRYQEALELMYCSFYCDLYRRIENSQHFGTTRTRHLKTVLEMSKKKLSRYDLEFSIERNIPQYYDEEKINILYAIIQTNLK